MLKFRYVLSAPICKCRKFSTNEILSESSLSTNVSPIAVMLIPEDYPPSFRGKVGGKLYAHKDDYNVTSTPIKPEVFLYRGSDGARDRLFVRASSKMNNNADDNTFTSATFLLDTGCCSHFNISFQLKPLLKDRIIRNEGREFFIFTEIGGEKHQCIVKTDIYDIHKPVNVMGLPMFFALSVSFKKGRAFGFALDEEDVAHDIASFEKFEYI